MSAMRTVGGPANVVLASSPLSQLVVRTVVAVSGQASLAEAAQLMALAEVSALLVDEPMGIVTERDLARAMGAGVSADVAVETVATPHPLMVDGTMTVFEAAALMLNEEVRHLIVRLSDGERSVVSMRDLLAVLLGTADGHLWLTSLRIAIELPTEVWLG